jgi:8-oxo-dGTP diphosphatase
MHLFHAEKFTGSLIDCDEGTLEWVPKAQVRRLPLWEGDHIFLDLLEEKAPFFSLKLVYEGDVLRTAVLNGKAIR